MTQDGTRDETQGTAGDWQSILAGITGGTGDAGATTAATTGATTTVAAHEPGTQRIAHGSYDARLYDLARAQTPRLERAITETAASWAQVDDLSRDVFQALYQATPEAQDVDAAHAENARAIDAMLDTSDYQGLHDVCTFDELGAAIGAATLTRALAQELAKQAEQTPPPPPEPPTPPSGNGQGDGQGDGAGDGQGDGAGNGQGAMTPEQQAQAEAAQAAQDYARAQRKHAKAMARYEQRQATNLRIAARAATGAATEAVAAYQQATQAFAGDDMGLGDESGAGWGRGAGAATSRGSIIARAKLAAEVAKNPRLQRIAALAGRMRLLAQTAQRRKAEHLPEEVVGVTRGNDLQRMMPAEMALLGDETLRLLWMARYAERGLMQYDLHGTEPQGRGPIILCVDESESMEGQASEWGAGVGLYLRAIARKERRDFIWIHFGWRDELDTDEYPGGRGTPEQTLASATHFFNGGTDFDTPLRAALGHLTTARYEKADVIFATDGICAVSPDVLRAWNAAKKARGFACFGVLIGASYGAHAMRPFCDDVADVLRPGVDDSAALLRAFSV